MAGIIEAVCTVIIVPTVLGVVLIQNPSSELQVSDDYLCTLLISFQS
jgi:hypothetical protein